MADIVDMSEEEDELYEHYAFKVEKGQQPLRIDKYLMNSFSLFRLIFL